MFHQLPGLPDIMKSKSVKKTNVERQLNEEIWTGLVRTFCLFVFVYSIICLIFVLNGTD